MVLKDIIEGFGDLFLIDRHQAEVLNGAYTLIAVEGSKIDLRAIEGPQLWIGEALDLYDMFDTCVDKRRPLSAGHKLLLAIPEADTRATFIKATD